MSMLRDLNPDEPVEGGMVIREGSLYASAESCVSGLHEKAPGRVAQAAADTAALSGGPLLGWELREQEARLHFGERGSLRIWLDSDRVMWRVEDAQELREVSQLPPRLRLRYVSAKMDLVEDWDPTSLWRTAQHRGLRRISPSENRLYLQFEGMSEVLISCFEIPSLGARILKWGEV